MIAYATIREASRRAHDKGRRALANGTPIKWGFLVPLLDVPGSEVWWVKEKEDRVLWQPMDDDERAAIFRSIERAPRVHLPELAMERRLTTFEEVEPRLPGAEALREARRCMTCGCRKADCCTLRNLATEYGAEIGRFAGTRRRFSEDASHPEIVYEPGKCINCDACVRIAAEAGEELGLSMIGRGFDVRVAPPFGKPMAEALAGAARRCAESCPTGAISLRTARACDCTGDAGCAFDAAPRPARPLVRITDPD